MSKSLSIEQVIEARNRMAGVIHLTPLDYSRFFSMLTGSNLYLKLENMQKTGSFKIRGAYNKINSLSFQERAGGVVAASAGNHAQGVAYAASRSGLKAAIVMPEGTPITKIMASRGYGAEVIISGRDYDEAFEKAVEIQKTSGATYIHGFDDIDVVAGQGTLGLEILEQLARVDAVVAPVGGGGLLGGISFVLKELRPQVKVYGVQSAGAPAVYLSLKKGEFQEETPASGTIAEGINVRRPGKMTLDLIKKYVDDVVLVDDEEISQTILMLLERTKVVSEGAGAAGLAAVLHDRLKLRGLNVVVVISGGNIDVNVLSTIIERGLIKSGRRLRIKTVVSDRPGSLRKIISLVADQQVNIISIVHDRLSPKVPIKDAEVEFILETMNWDHVEKVIATLKKAGYSLEIL
ncbi:MAG: threonine ammonia-lyase [Peptococcaceae bacterium]|nr:threonine ammonia-lyase [Peptococcaceae bacterium]